MKPSTISPRSTSRRTSQRIAQGAVLAVLLGAAAVFGAHGAAPSNAVAGQGDFVGLVDIGGGRRMYLECRGQGSPTVVLVSGYGNHGGVWSVDSPEVPQPQVLPAVARFTRVCAYDRPGTIGLDLDDRSRSDPVPQPRTAEDAMADLHALLRAAQVSGPYVLVGHSLGGLLVRLYAATYPDEVVGLVLVDATSEHLRAALTPEEWALTVEMTGIVPPELASYPEFERVDFNAAYDAMVRAAAAEPLRPMPLVVLSRGREDELPPGFPDSLPAAWRASQAFLAALLPDAHQVIVTEASHYIQLQQPQAVIDAIRQVVTEIHGSVSRLPVATGDDVAGLIDIGGGRRLYLECRGQGSPTVVLVAGYRSNGGVWSVDYLQPDAPRPMVLPAVAASTRVCAYDRPGTIFDPNDPAAHDHGDPIAQPTSAAPMVSDLHALLQAARVPGPYVLAGHSLGGLLVRLYAATYPDEVAGLVLVDALSEEIQARMTPAQSSAYVALLLQPVPGFDTSIETVDVGASFAQMHAAATPLRPMPLAVLSKGQPFELPEDLPAGFSRDAFEQAWLAAQADLPQLVANARHSVAIRSGHGIQVEQPALVTEAIRQVVAGVRDPDTWHGLVSCCKPAGSAIRRPGSP